MLVGRDYPPTSETFFSRDLRFVVVNGGLFLSEIIIFQIKILFIREREREISARIHRNKAYGKRSFTPVHYKIGLIIPNFPDISRI